MTSLQVRREQLAAGGACALQRLRLSPAGRSSSSLPPAASDRRGSTRSFGALWLVSTSSLSPTLSRTLNVSSPISGRTGVKLVSPFDRSRTKTALPSLPLPRSEMVRIAKRSSSVVSRM